MHYPANGVILIIYLESTYACAHVHTQPHHRHQLIFGSFLQSHLADERHSPLHEDLTVSQIVKKWLQSFALQSGSVINFSLFHG